MDIWGYKYPCPLYPKGRRAHTLLEEPFWRLKGGFQILLHLQKLQAILSRGRTWESRGIPGEKSSYSKGLESSCSGCFLSRRAQGCLESSSSKEPQRKGAKEIHKYFMAKKSLNESRKSTIQKVVALTAHSKSSEHSSSSSKHKKSNGSTRSENEIIALKAEKQKLEYELKNTKYTSLASVREKKNENKTKLTFVKAAANKNSANSNEKLVKVLVQKRTEKKKNAIVKKIHLLPPSVQNAPRHVPNLHHAKSHQKAPPSPHSKSPHMKRRFQQMHTCQGKYQEYPDFVMAVSTLVPGSVGTSPSL
ncbi:hypothetical protein Taro_006893 [Colocasia esculenta]|uniref:Uncharacterized protein n=1 Tax=Colocasia esculenta TaxID=4460 RepID=A0A843TSI8_COLES|nr:hypothetical protein [Colocasia esculenta]